jgi:hypothetical protein
MSCAEDRRETGAEVSFDRSVGHDVFEQDAKLATPKPQPALLPELGPPPRQVVYAPVKHEPVRGRGRPWLGMNTAPPP